MFLWNICFKPDAWSAGAWHPDRESGQGLVAGALAEAVSGIYAGWASVGDSKAVYPQVMSIGWNPFYKNEVCVAGPTL